MLRKRYITILWGQVATRLPCLSGKKMTPFAFCVKEQIKTPTEKLVKAITDVREGKFQPERENDELTRALENP